MPKKNAAVFYKEGNYKSLGLLEGVSLNKVTIEMCKSIDEHMS